SPMRRNGSSATMVLAAVCSRIWARAATSSLTNWLAWAMGEMRRSDAKRARFIGCQGPAREEWGRSTLYHGGLGGASFQGGKEGALEEGGRSHEGSGDRTGTTHRLSISGPRAAPAGS